MKILVVGSGAREHAIVRALRSEEVEHEVIAAPGNAGMARDGVPTVAVDPLSPDQVSDFALQHDIDLVVIGPEAPLVAGVADALRTRGIPAFGPGGEAAQIETSKSFAKRIMTEAGVPTGGAASATTRDEIAGLLDEYGAPYVVKADGLAAGKGVLVTDDRAAALAHAETWLEKGPVVIEEHLAGDEISLFLLSDGETVRPLIPAQDYKRVGEGGTGPNTGGMGAYAPVPWLAERFGSVDAFVDHIMDAVGLPVVRQLDREGTPFIGVLYCGLMVKGTDIRVLEFNARFGDPETQAILPLLETPLSELLLATANGSLERLGRPQFRDQVAVDVVLASEGYPVNTVTGRVIDGLNDAGAVEGVHIDYAGVSVPDTAALGTELVSSGGRVLNVVARADTFESARARVYEAIEAITLEGSHYRRDIAEGV